MIRALCALLAAILLAAVPACAHVPEKAEDSPRRAPRPLPKVDRNGMELTDTGPRPPAPPPNTVYQAVASWYGPGFGGRRTASGEVFDMDGLTAAHRTYPFGTKLRLTHPKTGRTCVVTVNDRGPFVAGVDIDISRGASRAIGRLDTGPVLIEEIGRDMAYVREARTGRITGSGYWRVQCGSFLDPANAEHLKRGLEISYQDVRIVQARVDKKMFNRVQVGALTERREAYALAGRLAEEGYETWLVRE